MSNFLISSANVKPSNKEGIPQENQTKDLIEVRQSVSLDLNKGENQLCKDLIGRIESYAHGTWNAEDMWKEIKNVITSARKNMEKANLHNTSSYDALTTYIKNMGKCEKDIKIIN